MSWVTNVLISTRGQGGVESTLDIANEWLAKDRNGLGHGGGLVHATKREGTECHCWYGGTKYMEADIWAGAFNCLDLSGFIEMLKTLPWPQPELVQIFIMDQEDFIFTVHTVPHDMSRPSAI